MSEEALEIFEKKIYILKDIQGILIETPDYSPVFDNSDPKEKRQTILNQISDRQEKSLKHLKLSIKYLQDSMYKLGHDFADEPVEYDDL